MAGQNNQQGIGSNGCTYRSNCCGITELLGQLRIGYGLPEGDFTHSQPYLPLKVCTPQTDGQVEDLSLSRKVLPQLLLGFKQERIQEFALYGLLGKFHFRKAVFSDAELYIS
jgi:hypothetical protein